MYMDILRAYIIIFTYHAQFSIRYRGAFVRNSILKLDINPDTSEDVFVKTIKECIMNGALQI